MRIFETRDEAYREAIKVWEAHRLATINEGHITLAVANERGEMVERKFKTFEVRYERYDYSDGWNDCLYSVAYKQ